MSDGLGAEREEYPRSALQPMRLYHCQPTDEWFYTVDGIGCNWFDSKAEALEQTDAFGEPIIHINVPLAD